MTYHTHLHFQGLCLLSAKTSTKCVHVTCNRAMGPSNYIRFQVSKYHILFSTITNEMQRYTRFGTGWQPVPTFPRQRQVAVKPAKYPMLCIQFWAPDDGRRTRLKHVENFSEINTLCNIASCWLYLKSIYGARIHECQIYRILQCDVI
jgi:hypothetical protein